MAYKNEDLQFIDQQPLEDVMLLFSRRPLRSTEYKHFYLCPFHKDTDPSFVVDRSNHIAGVKGYPVAGWVCNGCQNAKGYGAIALYSRMAGYEDARNLPKVVRELCAKLNLKLPSGDYQNDAWRNRTSKDVPPQKEIQFDDCLWSEAHLKALGCRTMAVGTTNFDQTVYLTDGEGRIKTRTDWDQRREDGSFLPLDVHQLERLFSVHPAEGYITEAHQRTEPNGDITDISYHYSFTEGYPIFYFKYQDAQGWYIKKYEPNFKPHLRDDGKQAANYKFTWWFQGGKKRGSELNSRLYGDIDVMNALAGKPIETSCVLHPLFTDTRTNEQGDEEAIQKFAKVIICSGPRDAINVWYHSDAHVVYPHSESVEITDAQMAQIRRIAHEIYVLYDVDNTGTKNAQQLCLRFQDVRLVQLPKTEMQVVRSIRTGKPCKDVSEYFANWDAIRQQFPHPEDYRKCPVNVDFKHRLQSALTMQFLKAEVHIKAKTKELYMKYTLEVENMLQFLSARGLMRSPKCYTTNFVLVRQNIVEGIDDKMVLTVAKDLMKEYQRMRDGWCNDISNAISTSNRLTVEMLKELPRAELQSKAWGQDFDFFYFRNGALYISKDEIRLIPYTQFPYAVDKESLLPVDYIPWHGTWPFSIVESPEMAVRQNDYLSSIRSMGVQEQARKNKEFTEWKRQNRFLLKLEHVMNEMPEVFQYIFDTGRIKYYKESAHLPLTPDDVQFQVAHFVNKIGALGYYLSRYRTPTKQQMVVAVDYFRQQIDEASGRSGKSIFKQIVKSVRNIYDINGKDFRATPETLGKNFQHLRPLIHGGIFIDDVHSTITPEMFYNLTTSIHVIRKFKDDFRVDEDVAPKLWLTSNRKFNMDEPSTLGRIYPMYFGDYYHQNDVKGSTLERTPETKFGHRIIAEHTEEELARIRRTNEAEYNRLMQERSFVQNLCAYALQFWFRFQEIIFPPLESDDDAKERTVEVDATFVEWADQFFSYGEHYGILIPVDEMVYSYLVYRGNPDATGKRKYVPENMLQRISDNKREFRNNLDAYCNLHHIVNTPKQLYTSEYDRKNRVIRAKHWVTLFDDKGREVYPHRLVMSTNPNGSDKAVPCRCFFRPGDVIPDNKRDLKPIPREEPDADWLMVTAD